MLFIARSAPALQLLLQQAADRLPPGIWATSHQATLNAVCRRLWRSYLAVACLSQQPGACRDSGDVAYAREVHERLGKSCWERVACCLPLWDAGRGVRQEKGAVAALCRSALVSRGPAPLSSLETVYCKGICFQQAVQACPGVTVGCGRCLQQPVCTPAHHIVC
jgi:hypothetical protein